MIKLVAGIIIGVFYKSDRNIYRVELPRELEYKSLKLILNGYGNGIKFFIKVYKVSLYLGSRNSNAEEIVNSNKAMCLCIDITSSLVTRKVMKQALNKWLESTGNNSSPIIKEIVDSIFSSDISLGDFYEFIYIPYVGTDVFKNSNYIDTVLGLNFKKSFFGIFLSTNPIQKSLKKELLGR